MKQFIKFVGYIILAILITVTGFIIYFNTGKSENLDPESFVPNDAIILVETENIAKTLSDFDHSGFLGLIQSFPFITETIQSLNEEKYKWLKTILEHKKATFSIHPSPSKTGDFLFIVDIDKYSKVNFIPQIASHFNKTLNYRKINSLNVYSIKINDDEQPIHFVVLQNLLICANSYKTIENSIHSLYKDEKEQPELTMTKSSFSKKDLNIYIHEDGFQQLNNLKNIHLYTDGLAFSSLSQTTKGKNIMLTGYTSYYDTIPSVFQTLKHLHPGLANDYYIIPSDIDTYVNININDFHHLYTELMDQLSNYDPIKFAVYAGGMKLTQSYLNIDIVNDIFKWMSGEISIATLKKPSDEIIDKDFLVVVKANDIQVAVKKLDFLSHRVNTDNFKSLYYKDYKIQYLNISGFFKLLLNNYINTREKPFYTIIDDYILFSTSDEIIKQTIDSYTSGQTLENNTSFKSVLNSKKDQHYLSALYKINSLKNKDEHPRYMYLEMEPEANLLKTEVQLLTLEK